MDKVIKAQLSNIEKENEVKILNAVESGTFRKTLGNYYGGL